MKIDYMTKNGIVVAKVSSKEVLFSDCWRSAPEICDLPDAACHCRGFHLSW
jgi:hypothetical protein